jgi:hypothetical protein
MTLEQARLDDNRERGIAWKKWGPYLSERQTGWTGLVARLLHLFATLTPERALEGGKVAMRRQTTV